MKKTKTPENVHDYIAQFPKPIQKKLKTLRSLVLKNAKGVNEKIGYGIPSYNFQGMLLYYAAFKNHLGFFAMPSAIVKFEKQLKKYSLSKGTIRFPLDEELPEKLISRIIKFRVQENISKKKGKKDKPKMFR